MIDSSCPWCAQVDAAPRGDVLWHHCRGCGVMLFRPAPGPRVAVIHESDEIGQQIGEALLAHGLFPVRAAGGPDALGMLERVCPLGLVLDVGLVDPTAFAIVAHVRSDARLKGIKILLVASVFDRTQYKRRPRSLYGADDYVEQHHIVDYLPERLSALLGFKPGPEAAGPPPTLAKGSPADVTRNLTGATRIRAAAKRIVADIALYHQAELERAQQTGSAEVLETALVEGRSLLAKLADLSAYPGDPIEDAFAELLSGLRRSEP